MPRDSRNAKTDMQTESLKFFVAYSTTHTATSARGRERDEQLAQGKPFNLSIRSFVRLSPTVYADAQTSKLTFFCSQESALKCSLLKLSRLFLQPLVHLL